MKNTAITILLAAVAIVSTSVAQNARPLPPASIVAANLARGTTGASEVTALSSHRAAPATKLFFCPSKSCLYYAGDWDTTSSSANGLFDFDNPGIGISDAEVWVGVKPTKNATVTGTSGNYFTNTTAFGINPTPFAVQTGITPGHGGKTVCKTRGNAVLRSYGCVGIGNCENYWIRKLKKSCPLKKGKVYFISMQPQYDDGFSGGYLMDDDGQHANKQGWPEIKDKSYFNSTSFRVNYQPTWGSHGACGGIGCSGFSISLTGKQD
jgi:hypothetical protein